MVGQVILNNFFSDYFQLYFLKMFNLGIPEILKMNLVLILKFLIKNKGKDVIKCIIKNSALYFFKQNNKGKNEIKKINI